MNQNPTLPPKPVRPPPKPIKIPPVKEVDATGNRILVDPYAGLKKIAQPVPEARKRLPSASDVEIGVALHTEQIKTLERRVDTVEGTLQSFDTKLDTISSILTQEKHDRELNEAKKEEDKVQEDQKTKRFQALLVALPLILSGLLAFYTAYKAVPDPPQKHEVVKVVVSEYTEEAQKCLETQKRQDEFEQCIRNAQLRNTPLFRR